MEQLEYGLPSATQARAREPVLVGVVGSGNCEVLVEGGGKDGRCEVQRGGDLWQLLVTITLHKLHDQVKRHRRAVVISFDQAGARNVFNGPHTAATKIGREGERTSGSARAAPREITSARSVRRRMTRRHSARRPPSRARRVRSPAE